MTSFSLPSGGLKHFDTRAFWHIIVTQIQDYGFVTVQHNCFHHSYPRKSGKFSELPLFLNQEIFCGFPLQGKAETSTKGYSMGSEFPCWKPTEDFPCISLGIPCWETQETRKSSVDFCQNFLVGNLLKISLAFPLDFLAGKPKNTGSAGYSQDH